MSTSHELSNFIWTIADLLRGAHEINITRHFYRFTQPRSLEEIDADPERAKDEVLRLLREVPA